MNNPSPNIFIRSQASFYPVVKFNSEKEKLVAVDLSASATDLSPSVMEDTVMFTAYIHKKTRGAKFGIGGYAEYRDLYRWSSVFDAEFSGAEPRRVHLGTDIWGSVGTPVFAPIGGMVHGFGFNDNFGDYGATLIIQHQLEGFGFYTLYGHISLSDMYHIQEGDYLIRGQEIAHLGNPDENGHWPPHLHFQVIFDIGMNRSDYPGVCRFSESEKYLSNCPDPDLILDMNKYL